MTMNPDAPASNPSAIPSSEAASQDNNQDTTNSCCHFNRRNNSNNNSRRGNHNSQSQRSGGRASTSSFRGATKGLNGHVFQTQGEQPLQNQYQRTIEEFQVYIAQEYKDEVNVLNDLFKNHSRYSGSWIVIRDVNGLI